MKLLQVRGDINPYFKMAAGTPELNLLSMARAGLFVELRTAIYQAQRQNLSVRKEGVSIEASGRSTIVNLEVRPFQPPTVAARYFLVVFEEVLPTAGDFCTLNSEICTQCDLEPENARLREELATANQARTVAQAHLESLINQQKNLNEDLKIANEEILSSNEELQSANEELETATEEIKAANEGTQHH